MSRLKKHLSNKSWKIQRKCWRKITQQRWKVWTRTRAKIVILKLWERHISNTWFWEWDLNYLILHSWKSRPWSSWLQLNVSSHTRCSLNHTPSRSCNPILSRYTTSTITFSAEKTNWMFLRKCWSSTTWWIKRFSSWRSGTNCLTKTSKMTKKNASPIKSWTS